MKVIETSLPGVLLIEPRVFGDSRGYFLETWSKREFAELGLTMEFVQDNHSFSGRHTLRGLHYQLQNTQGKLVRVGQGEVFDVVVDLRRSSPHFGKWAGVHLSGDNNRMLWVPEGFAHGFCVLSETVHFLYKCTDLYNPAAERTLAWDDPAVGIDWPLPAGAEPILSAKDRLGKSLQDIEAFD